MEKKFKTNDEFMAHLLATVQSDKMIYAYEDGFEHGSVTEEDEFNIYWLGADFSISNLAITLLSLFGSNLVMAIDHNLDQSFELGDTGRKLWEKHLTVTGWWNDEVGINFSDSFTIKDANKEEENK